MSGNTVDRSRTFLANGNLSTKQFTFVKLGTTQNDVVNAVAGTDKTIGVLMNAPVDNDTARVTLLSAEGTLRVIASTTIAIAAYITATTGGKAVTTASAGDIVCGVAIDAATADGDVIEFMPTFFKF